MENQAVTIDFHFGMFQIEERIAVLDWDELITVSSALSEWHMDFSSLLPLRLQGLRNGGNQE